MMDGVWHHTAANDDQKKTMKILHSLEKKVQMAKLMHEAFLHFSVHLLL